MRRRSMVIRLWRENDEFLAASKEYTGESKNELLNLLLAEIRKGGFEHLSTAIEALERLRITRN